MKTTKFTHILLAAAGVVALSSAPALAHTASPVDACHAHAKADTFAKLIQAISVVKNHDMNWGKIAYAGSAHPITLKMDEHGNVTSPNSVIACPVGHATSAPTFTITAQQGCQFQLDFDRDSHLKLENHPDKTLALGLHLASLNEGTHTSNGTDILKFGEAQLTIPAHAPLGNYQGEINVTVNYI